MEPIVINKNSWMNKKDKEQVQKALSAAITALDDWTNVFASEFCDEARVEEAKNRLIEHGTVYYIATIVEQCREARKLIK